MNILDLIVFGGYLTLTIIIASRFAFRANKTSQAYYLGNKNLPWFVVGAAMTSANISTQHFIGMSGAAYGNGLVVANYEWLVLLLAPLVIFVFVPFYLRSQVYTTSEFLELRYGRNCRFLYSAILIFSTLCTEFAAVLYAGSIALHTMFNIPIFWGIIALISIAALYTVNGGLSAVAWIDSLQLIVLFIGGFIVSLICISKAGGWSNIVAFDPSRITLYRPLTDPYFSFPSILILFLCVVIWYGCANQLMIQKCLAARNELHARKGLVWWSFIAYLKPFLFVVPGMAGYVLVQQHVLHVTNPDEIYPTIIKYLVPPGIRGLILASLVAAIISNISSAVNTLSTIITIDFIRNFRKQKITPRSEVLWGKGIAIMCFFIGLLLTLYLMKLTQNGEFRGVFHFIQNIYSYVAAPFTVIFLSAIFWKRANSYGALMTGCAGIPIALLLQNVILPLMFPNSFFQGNWLYSTGVAFVVCWIIMITVSLLTSTQAKPNLPHMQWNTNYLFLEEKSTEPFYKNYILWFFITSMIGISLYIKFW